MLHIRTKKTERKLGFFIAFDKFIKNLTFIFSSSRTKRVKKYRYQMYFRSQIVTL
ncbi:hypothetical protein IV71_GL000859 [Fructobacillus fructosus KCTC 3544]|nr:hypothetical protein IV71_GL000859 [Fructobacillus fructosus KCTC 3544]